MFFLRKNFIWIILSLFTIFIFTIFVKSTKNNHCDLKISDQCITLERADTPDTRQQGLSGRDNLPINTGMLFVFEDSGEHCMWMKDMKFSLDMIWMDENGKIIKQSESISPATFPELFCANSKYVLELNPGTIKQAELSVGDSLKL